MKAIGKGKKASKALAARRIKGAIKAIKDDRKQMGERQQKEQSADFILTLVCDSQAQKQALCQLLRVPDYESFADAAPLIRQLGGEA